MTLGLQTVLEQLEQNTEELCRADLEDLGHIVEALERRSGTLAAVASFLQEISRSGDARQRLTCILTRGEQAIEHALERRREITEEWVSGNRLLKALDSTCTHDEPKFDCCA